MPHYRHKTVARVFPVAVGRGTVSARREDTSGVSYPMSMRMFAYVAAAFVFGMITGTAVGFIVGDYLGAMH